MFPVSKLKRLALKTALRKISLILQKYERGFSHQEEITIDGRTHQYLASLFQFIQQAQAGEHLRALASREAVLPLSSGQAVRSLNRMRHAILRFLGAEPAEWDFINTASGSLDGEKRTIFPVWVYLEEIRSPFNVGSIMRSAEAFGVARVLISETTPFPTHPRAARTARGAEQVLPWSVATLDSLSEFGPVFALETGGETIDTFAFPTQGTVLVGSEELGLSPEALELAKRSLGRVSIPLAGAKRSLNVAVAFGIIMQRWYSFLKAPF